MTGNMNGGGGVVIRRENGAQADKTISVYCIIFHNLSFYILTRQTKISVTSNKSVSSIFPLSPSSCWKEVSGLGVTSQKLHILCHHTLQDPLVLLVSQDLLEVLPKPFLLPVDLIFCIPIGNGEQLIVLLCRLIGLKTFLYLQIFRLNKSDSINYFIELQFFFFFL